MDLVKLSKEELEKILENHEKWLKGETGGVRADLSYVDLSGTALRGVNLSNARLCGANLNHADLYNVDLSDSILTGACLFKADLGRANLTNTNLFNAKLIKADLTNANLTNAYLGNANLNKADLSNANLTNAYLCHAALIGTDLCCANLYKSNLKTADLYGAYLQKTNLSCADLTNSTLEYSTLCDTNLSGATGGLIEFRKGKVLTEPMVGYKKCRDGVIVTLEIPEGAIVFSINGDKCRTNKVKVLAIDGADKGISYHNGMSYYPGDEIVIRDFDCTYNAECATGIHFFVDREAAEKY